ncbi:PQQ-binding-like beta-propeller repeat protein [Kitasatospora sp. NPDC088346]|uniref:outer membrane protein assembly factor BamB family protein n=1 Tax=Kitasatospora sp. NPDC088346 TaxID=3364073 RepID=UPI00382D31CD
MAPAEPTPASPRTAAAAPAAAISDLSEELPSGEGPVESSSDVVAGRPDHVRPTRRTLVAAGAAGAAVLGLGLYARGFSRPDPPPRLPAPRFTGPAPLWTYRGTERAAPGRLGPGTRAPLFPTAAAVDVLDPATGTRRLRLPLAADGPPAYGSGRSWLLAPTAERVHSLADGRLDGHDLRTGHPDRPVELAALLGGRVTSHTLLGTDGHALICTADLAPTASAGPAEVLFAVDPAAGRLVWSRSRREQDSLLLRTGLLDGRLFALDTGERLVAVDTRDGRTLWRAPAGPSVSWLAPLPDRVCLGVDPGDLRVLAALDGSPLRPPSRPPGATWRYLPPITDGRALYAVRSDGEITALAPEDGRQLWSCTLPYRVDLRSVPLVVGRVLYVPGGADDGVTAVDVADGRTLWTFTDGLPGVDVWWLGTDGERLFAGHDSVLHALPTA